MDRISHCHQAWRGLFVTNWPTKLPYRCENETAGLKVLSSINSLLPKNFELRREASRVLVNRKLFLT